MSTVFYKLQLNYFKSFLIFASIAMTLYSGLLFAFASRTTINSIILDSENSILSKELENVLGKSYYQLSDNVLNSFTIVDQSIKTIQIINFSDNVLYLGVIYYEKVAVVKTIEVVLLLEMFY